MSEIVARGGTGEVTLGQRKPTLLRAAAPMASPFSPDCLPTMRAAVVEEIYERLRLSDLVMSSVESTAHPAT
jgi:hypothetical protein